MGTFTANVSWHRPCFVTNSGMIGIGSRGTNKEDFLCVLYGADLPFIFRPKDKGYKLIDESYVPDVMQGEIIEMLADRSNELHETWIELI